VEAVAGEGLEAPLTEEAILLASVALVAVVVVVSEAEASVVSEASEAVPLVPVQVSSSQGLHRLVQV